jgi:hypothetical protein
VTLPLRVELLDAAGRPESDARRPDLCLDSGFILKNSTAFNVLFFEGSVPRLVDVRSLEQYRDGMLGRGYGQSCRAFLFPIFLLSYRCIHPRGLHGEFLPALSLIHHPRITSGIALDEIVELLTTLAPTGISE